jgi:hypothetical protein
MLYLSSAVRVLEDFAFHRQFVGDSERESHNVTTTKTHLPTSAWHNPSVLACRRVPGCMEAFFEVNSFDQDHKAFG